MAYSEPESPWLRLVDPWVPEAARSTPEALQRARFVVSAGLVQMAVTTTVSIVWGHNRGPWYGGIFATGTLLLGACLLLFRKAYRVEAIVHVNAVIPCAIVAALARFWGAPSALSFTTLTLIPASMQLLGGSRAGAIWFAITMGAMVGYHALRALGVAPQALFTPPQIVQATFPLAFGAILYGFARLYDQWRARAIDELAAANRELLALREQADGAARAKSEFLATVSHEVRTPMNGVLGMVSLLRETRLDGEQRRYLEVLQESGDALMRILNDVLDYEKYEAGRMNLRDEDFSPGALAEAVAALLTPRANEAGVSLMVSVDPTVPGRARGDGGRVRQVLLNLTSNAVKFTRRGAVRLSVRVEGETLRFAVADSGVGVAPAVAARLFEPFSQGDDDHAGRRGTSGLGLAICRRLVTAMGGEIGFESREGEGSTFWFWVPLCAPSDEARPSTLAPTPDVARGTRVLLVEDNPVNELVARRFLARHGVECDVTRNGEEALARLATTPYDVVFMDCHMPVMDGFEATRRYRASGGRTPVVAMTAGVLESDRHACAAAGMDDFVSKPFRAEQIGELLHRYCGADSVAAPRATA